MKVSSTPLLALCCSALMIGTSSAALKITEVMSSSSGTGATNGDWFEVTNTGSTQIILSGYYWDDNGPSGNDGALFPSFSIDPGESIVIVDESNANLPTWMAAWGGGFTAISSDDFGGPDPFSGLGASGDQIEIWDTDPNVGPANLAASAVFGAASTGSSFEWDAFGNSLGLSTSGENGAFTNTSGDIGSPGIAIVPEPSSILLVALGLVGIRRRR